MKTFNTILVKIGNTHDDKILMDGGLELHVPLNQAVARNEEGDVISNSNTKVKIYGEAASDMVLRPPSEIAYELPVGEPRPKRYKGSDDIERRLKTLTPRQKKEWKGSKALAYVCSSWEGAAYVFHHDQDIEIKQGDKVYFHYLGYDKENYLKTEGGFKYYTIPFESLYCVVRDGEIKMVNGNVFITPYYGDDYVKTTLKGAWQEWVKFYNDTEIIEDVGKKPEFLHGMVAHIGEGLGPDTRKTVNKGDHILFRPIHEIGENDFTDKVEGEEYFTMKQWDIIAKVVDGKVVPVGDYIALTPENKLLSSKRKVHKDNDMSKVTDGSILLLESSVKKQNGSEGIAISCGELVKDIQPDLRIVFKEGAGIYLEEYDMMFIRECFVYGAFVE